MIRRRASRGRPAALVTRPSGAPDVHGEVTDDGRARSAPRLLGGAEGDTDSAPSGDEPRGDAAAHVASVAAAAPLASSVTEVRTTSGHLMTLAPKTTNVRSSRMAWAIAAFAGVLCGIVVLVLRSPRPRSSAAADAGPITMAVPELDAGSPDAAAAIAETPDAEAPDAAAEGAPDAAAEDASDAEAPAAGKIAGRGQEASQRGRWRSPSGAARVRFHAEGVRLVVVLRRRSRGPGLQLRLGHAGPAGRGSRPTATRRRRRHRRRRPHPPRPLSRLRRARRRPGRGSRATWRPSRCPPTTASETDLAEQEN